MSFVTVPQFLFPVPPNIVSSAPNLTGSSQYNINGVGEYVAFVFCMPETAVIDACFWAINTATTGCTCLARVETVDTATGLPSGTLAHANASQSVVIGTGRADYDVTFPGTFTLDQGAIYALILVQSSGTPVAIQPMAFGDDNSGSGLPYVIDFDGSATLRQNVALCVGLSKSGGGKIPMRHAWPITDVGITVYDAVDTPDTVGNQIVLDAPMRVSGAWIWIDCDGPGTIKLYDTDGATVLASATMETNVPPTSSAFANNYYFSSPVELPAGTYFLAAEGTDATLTVGISYCDFPAASWRAGSPMGGGIMTYATCSQTPVNTGSWTLTDTRQAFMGLIIDGIESGGGGGGGGETSHVFAS
jgi:hypothetical protein